ncbi:MAG: hypothetical protein R3324_20770 [Halobacteriales archaeon]|nr:hypothetical protein [Halobacteriales archaeon]
MNVPGDVTPTHGGEQHSADTEETDDLAAERGNVVGEFADGLLSSHS